MPAPTLKSFASRIYADLAPLELQEAANGYALANYVGAHGEMYQIVEDLARDQIVGGKTAPGWSQVLDITRCPPSALAWLAQFVGGTTQAGLSDTDQRNFILNVGGWSRGTAASMRNAILPLLTGGKTVIFSERNGTNDVVYDFESGTMSWALQVGAVVTQDAVNFRGGGAHSLKVVTTSTNLSGVASPNNAFTANKLCGGHFSFKGAAGVSYRVYLWDTTHSAFIGTAKTIVGTGDWQEIVISGMAGTVAGNYFLGVDNSPQNVASTFYLDDVHLQNDGPYSLTVITRTAETPDSAAVLAALVAQKPAGIILTYAVTTGFTYLELRATKATYTATVSGFANYTALRGY